MQTTRRDIARALSGDRILVPSPLAGMVRAVLVRDGRPVAQTRL